MNRLLVIFFLFLLSGVATASLDYTNELFTYTDSSGEQFVVETHSTDGIILADPTRLRIINQSGEVVHTGDWNNGWTSTIISVQDSENKHTVFEYSGGIPVPEKTYIFEDGRFYEGEASLVSYVKSVAIYALQLFAFFTIMVILLVIVPILLVGLFSLLIVPLLLGLSLLV